MYRFWNIMLKGLAATLPVGLTIYLVYWLGVSVENLLRPIIASAIHEQYYIPGMGILAGLVALFLVGLVVNAWIIRWIIQLGEAILDRIPLVKTIYNALKDFTHFFTPAGRRKELGKVVVVKFAGARLIGFLMRENVKDIPGPGSHASGDQVGEEAGEMVAVYLPMSYQIGGYTVYLPRNQVETIDMATEDAMRLVLTAGLSTS